MIFLKIISFVIGLGLVLLGLALTVGMLIDWSSGKTQSIFQDLLYFFFLAFIPGLIGIYCLFYATGNHLTIHNYIGTLVTKVVHSRGSRP